MEEYKHLIKFEFESNNYSIYMKTEDVMLDDIIEKFELFIKSCGFNFDGHIDVVGEDND